MVEVTRATPGAFKTLTDHLKALESKQLKAGWVDPDRYENGFPVAAAAATAEYGNPSRSIPPRPILRPTIADKRPAWRDLAARGAKAILAGKESPESVLAKIGEQIVGDIQETITGVTTPALSPITLELRKWKLDNPDKTITGRIVGEAAARTHEPGWQKPDVSDKPLIDVGPEGGRMLSSVNSRVEDSTP